MKALAMVPLFAFVLIAYNLLIFLAGEQSMTNVLFTIPLISGEQWTLALGELFLAAGVVVLYLEMVKATRTTSAAVLDHTLSMVVFVIFLIEFLVVPRAGTSTFLILALMSLFDVVAGFTITIAAARRDFGFNQPTE